MVPTLRDVACAAPVAPDDDEATEATLVACDRERVARGRPRERPLADPPSRFCALVRLREHGPATTRRPGARVGLEPDVPPPGFVADERERVAARAEARLADGDPVSTGRDASGRSRRPVHDDDPGRVPRHVREIPLVPRQQSRRATTPGPGRSRRTRSGGQARCRPSGPPSRRRVVGVEHEGDERTVGARPRAPTFARPPRRSPARASRRAGPRGAGRRRCRRRARSARPRRALPRPSTGSTPRDPPGRPEAIPRDGATTSVTASPPAPAGPQPGATAPFGRPARVGDRTRTGHQLRAQRGIGTPATLRVRWTASDERPAWPPEDEQRDARLETRDRARSRLTPSMPAPSPVARPTSTAPHRLADLPGEPALRWPGRLHPLPRPRGRPSSATTSRSSPVRRTPSSTTRSSS